MKKKLINAILLTVLFFVPLSSAYAADVAACGGFSIGGFSFSVDAGCNVSGGTFDPGELNQFGLPNGTLSGIISTILAWLLGMLGVFGILGFLFSGTMYLISAGDDDLIKRAKTTMKYSIIGIIVGMLGLIVVNAVFNLLNADQFGI